MGVRVMWNHDDTKAVMYCSVSDWAFGPLFNDDNDHSARENAESFINWLHRTKGSDPRTLSDNDLEKVYADWNMRAPNISRCVLSNAHFGEHMFIETDLQRVLPGECGAKEETN